MVPDDRSLRRHPQGSHTCEGSARLGRKGASSTFRKKVFCIGFMSSDLDLGISNKE